MRLTSKPAVVGVFCLVCLSFVGALCVYPRYVSMSFPVIDVRMLEEVPLLSDFPSAKIPPAAAEQFLEGDFSIVRDLRALPAPVLRGLTGKDGSSLAMTNPWGRIQESDDLVPGVPGARLIFAGTSRDRGFVHFEVGGMWRSYALILFTISSDGAKTIWQGSCNDRAANLRDLRTRVLNGACKHFFPPAFVQPPIKADVSSVFPAKQTTIPVTFTYINSDEPTCKLPPATIEIDRAVRKRHHASR
jgi:hypothetical protein